MEINDIPQDNSKIFRGQRKVVYATQNGNYQTATSNGWETEEFATEQAVEELNQLTAEALVKSHRSFIICTVIVLTYPASPKPPAFGNGKSSDTLNQACLLNCRIRC